jgi:hypothetical protein
MNFINNIKFGEHFHVYILEWIFLKYWYTLIQIEKMCVFNNRVLTSLSTLVFDLYIDSIYNILTFNFIWILELVNKSL